MDQEVEMKQKKTALKAALVAAALIMAGAVGLASTPAEARVWVGFGVGVPYPYYYPYAPYYYPPPVVYAPPPVYAAPPAAPTALAPAPQSWYYCNNPQGYYPNVQSCPGGWQEVPAQQQR